ncbi:MAG TPA: hypothetical protein PKD64_06010 [Pirellulaceae bacterium]|nr:hypothetical protein [Pirellulaceae bacterium]HMO91734.1 hypothetical protein [Pirellulaceae bacterium]HMP69803.1 hypothetical protein [Pirellulaceae bacterium]
MDAAIRCAEIALGFDENEAIEGHDSIVNLKESAMHCFWGGEMDSPSKTGNDGATRVVGKKIGLLLVLIAACAALGYDFLIARTQYLAITRQVEQLANEPDAYNMSELKLHEALGRTPVESQVLTSRDLLLEKYSVRRGFLVSTFDMYVWYARRRDRWEYAGHRFGSEPTAEDFPLNSRKRFRIALDAKDYKIAAGGAASVGVDGISSPYEIPTEHLSNEAFNETAAPVEKKADASISAEGDTRSKMNRIE